ncbi:putative kinase [Tripterygium wilfordii]|uniref:Putative kinase n=1 Tax=Tripterygium wilfordii TaxID=458696 RepID=A0A7J7DXJ9_TRIWF|nr:putative kinase [Tripterygium wilfordii]
MMFGAFVGLGAMVIKWHKRPQDWQKRNSFSSWLLPLHAGDTSFMTSKNSIGSHKTNFYSSTLGLGRRGLSRYYSGKARSFTCMADVHCLEDLKKQEHIDAKKRKKYLERKELPVPPYPCRRVASTNQFATPFVGA